MSFNNPFLNKTEIKYDNNSFYHQISQEFIGKNDQESFELHNFCEENHSGEGDVEGKKKTKGSLKNIYINKINHMMKNAKNNQEDDEIMKRKFNLVYLKISSKL